MGIFVEMDYTLAIAIYIDEANPMPRNWEKEENNKRGICLERK